MQNYTKQFGLNCHHHVHKWSGEKYRVKHGGGSAVVWGCISAGGSGWNYKYGKVLPHFDPLCKSRLPTASLFSLTITPNALPVQ